MMGHSLPTRVARRPPDARSCVARQVLVPSHAWLNRNSRPPATSAPAAPPSPVPTTQAHRLPATRSPRRRSRPVTLLPPSRSIRTRRANTTRSRPCATSRRLRQAGRSDRRVEHRHRDERLREGRQRRADHRSQPDGRVARPRARRFDRAGADDQPGRAGRRQPELAQGRAARSDAARGLHPPREDHPLRSRAHSRAHRPCARLGGARLLRVLRAAGASTRGPRSSPRPASRRRCSCASRPCSASAARPTPRATCAASR